MQGMRAGQIILPTMRNDGTTSLAKTHERLASLLLAAFGGTTAIPGSGMYNNPDKGLQVEAVYSYTVAYVPSDSNDLALRSIAKAVGAEAGQDAVYVQYAGGVVELVNTAMHHMPAVMPAVRAINDNQPGVLPTEGEAWLGVTH